MKSVKIQVVKKEENNDGNNGDLDKVNTTKTLSIPGGDVDSKTRRLLPGQMSINVPHGQLCRRIFTN